MADVHRPSVQRPVDPQLVNWPLADLRDKLATGAVSAVDVARAFLAEIEAKEEQVQAWTHLDPEHVINQAKALDAYRGTGQPLGALHGIPVGLKDIIDTCDMPTENGTVLDAGRQPKRDSTVAARLRAAGAVIMGKAVSTELAFFSPGKTRNPHDPNRTPGGSSSGSAAAVAAGMVPLAIGTQTKGSVVRPASFCGVVGYKPTHGRIGRGGTLLQCHQLDTIGLFARDVDGAALAADVLFGFDPADTATQPRAASRLHETATATPPVEPLFAFVKTPHWDEADDDTKAAFAELMDALGDRCDEVDIGPVFAEAWPAQQALMCSGMARNLGHYEKRGADKLSQVTKDLFAEGREVSAIQFMNAIDWRDTLNAGLEKVFERYDAIITPSAPGEAPLGLGATGNPVFCAPWTFLGTPAISLPMMTGANGLPLGVQLVGRAGEDGRLLRTARHFMASLMDGEAS